MDDTATSVGNAGEHTFKADFTPEDTANYNSVSDVNVTVTVGKADNPTTVKGTASVIKGGNTVDLSENVELNGATGSVSYEIDDIDLNFDCALEGSILTSGEDTGNVTVNVTVAEDENYEALGTKPIKVSVLKKLAQTLSADDVTVTYGETEGRVSASVTDPATGGGAISYAVKDGSADYIDVDAATGALTVKKAGTATVVVTAAETQTYAQATKEVTVTIDKADAVPATVAANNRRYDGTEKPLLTVDDSTLAGGEMQYALGTETEATEDYATSIPTGTDAGTYYVWYKVVGDENHLDTQAVCVTSMIAPEFGDPDFAMPEGLAAIEEGAFEGVAFMAVVDAHTCAAIGQDTFKGTGLVKIRLPKDCEISDAAFDEAGTVYVYAPAGGTTEAYCAGHDNLVFIAE